MSKAASVSAKGRMRRDKQWFLPRLKVFVRCRPKPGENTARVKKIHFWSDTKQRKEKRDITWSFVRPVQKNGTRLWVVLAMKKQSCVVFVF